MDLLEIQDQLCQLELLEDNQTLDFIDKHYNQHLSNFDISNKYLVKNSAMYLGKMLYERISSGKTLKHLSMENCMLNEENLTQICKWLFKLKNPLGLKTLNLGNNKLIINEPISLLIKKLLDKVGRKKSVSVVFQGNAFSNSKCLQTILTSKACFTELNLYDCCVEGSCLVVLAEVIAENKYILKLDLSYNPKAFLDCEEVANFSISIGLNQHIQKLNLEGNYSLSSRPVLINFLSGLQTNKNLQKLNLASIELGDKGLSLLTKLLLDKLMLFSLDLQNNGITDKGFLILLKNLPLGLSELNVSYNLLQKNESLKALGQKLTKERTLRVLKISSAFEISCIQETAVSALCKGLRENFSLTDFICESTKIGDEPDLFCKAIGEAIASRRLSLTYKISAVNCFDSTATSMGSHSTFNLKRPSKSFKFNSLELPEPWTPR